MFHNFHVATYSAGSPGFVNGRQRGQVSIYSMPEGKLYLYKCPAYKGRSGEFRKWAERVFLTNDGSEKLTGRYPSYRVEVK